MADRSWREDALCSQVDPEIFFPDVGGSLAVARNICASCEVSDECLEDALAVPGKHDRTGGVRAGTTPRQRVRMRREWRETA